VFYTGNLLRGVPEVDECGLTEIGNSKEETRGRMHQIEPITSSRKSTPKEINSYSKKRITSRSTNCFEEIGSDVEDRLARTEALKRIGTAFPLGSGMVDKRDFPFLFPFRTGTTAGAG
jgi:hypothetical protein